MLTAAQICQLNRMIGNCEHRCADNRAIEARSFKKLHCNSLEHSKSYPGLVDIFLQYIITVYET